MKEKLVPVKSCTLVHGACSKRYYHLELHTDRPEDLVIDSNIVVGFYEDSGIGFDPNPEDAWMLVTADWTPNIDTEVVIVGAVEKEEDKGKSVTYLVMIDRTYCFHIVVDFFPDGPRNLDPNEVRRGRIRYSIYGDSFQTLRAVLPDLVP